MAELDVFEARFAAAYRRYLDEVPTDVDAVAMARVAATARPQARWTAWRAALRPTPALAWLALLGLLLAALVAGLVVVGSQLQRKLPAVVPAIGKVYVCPPGSNPDEPGPVDQARPTEGPHLSMAFDRRAGRLVVVVGVDDAVETWTFDVCTNTWTRMYPDQEPWGWVELAYDIRADRTIGWANCRDCGLEPHGVTWAYDLQANAWSKAGEAPADVTTLIYDPIAGHVVAVGSGRPYTPPPVIWSYDAEAGTWAPINQLNAAELDAGLVTYDGVVDRIIAFGPTADPGSADRATRLFDIRTGEWTWSDAVTPAIWGWDPGFWIASPAIAYDEAAQRTVIFGNGLAAYDATADRWEILVEPGDDPSGGLPSSMVHDPVNRRLVGLGRGVGVDQGGVVAFDLVTREWTVLLEPGGE